MGVFGVDMAQDSYQGERDVTEMNMFPPTVTGHDNYANGVELSLLDEGTEEEPRYIWCPDDENEEPVFSL